MEKDGFSPFPPIPYGNFPDTLKCGSLISPNNFPIESGKNPLILSMMDLILSFALVKGFVNFSVKEETPFVILFLISASLVPIFVLISANLVLIFPIMLLNRFATSVLNPFKEPLTMVLMSVSEPLIIVFARLNAARRIFGIFLTSVLRRFARISPTADKMEGAYCLMMETADFKSCPILEMIVGIFLMIVEPTLEMVCTTAARHIGKLLLNDASAFVTTVLTAFLISGKCSIIAFGMPMITRPIAGTTFLSMIPTEETRFFICGYTSFPSARLAIRSL